MAKDYDDWPEEQDPVFNNSPAAYLTMTDVRNIRDMPNYLKKIEKRKGEKGDPGRDGKDGRTPIKGKDYFRPEEVKQFVKTITPAKGKDYFTQEEIAFFIDKCQGKDGKDGKPGKDGIDGKDGKPGMDGKDGKDGKTPVKGKDYFTKDDISEVAYDIRSGINIPDVKKGIEKGIEAHEEKYDHELLHDPKLLGTVEVDEDNIQENRYLKYANGKLIYSDIPKQKSFFGKSGGGGASTLDFVPYTGARNNIDINSKDFTTTGTGTFGNGTGDNAIVIKAGSRLVFDG